MKKIEKGIVFIYDVERIFNGKNGLGFNYLEKEIITPSKMFLKDLREDFERDVNKIFENEITIVTEENMLDSIYNSISDVYGSIPIISLDKVYLNCDEQKIMFLDCTRLNGEDTLVSRMNTNNLVDVDNQVEVISNKLKNIKQKEIILADDVVFSGSVLRSVTKKFRDNNIKVVGIRSCISTIDAYNYFNSKLALGLNAGYLMEKDVIDQICERDFYFGVAQSGISVKIANGKVCKAPYFKPFGNPVERASIPIENEKMFSNGCLERSINLWLETEKMSNKKIFIRDLPEKINNTKDSDRVIKTLTKGVR